MAAITSANVASAIVKLVAVDALPALFSNLVMGSLVNRDFEPILAQHGDTVNVPIPPTLVANTIAEGSSVSTQNPSLGNAQIKLDTHAEATFQIPDVTKILAVPDLLKLYMEPAVIALAEKIESDLLGLYAQFTANTPLGANATPPTEAVLDAVETTLFNAKTPATADKYLVVDPNAYSSIRQIPRFSEYQTAGEAGIKAQIEGKIGKLKDLFILRSQLVPKTSAGANTQNMAFSKNAIGLCMRRLPQPLPGTGAVAEYAEMANFGMRVTMSYQPNTLSQQFTVDVLYGVGILRNSFGVRVLS